MGGPEAGVVVEHGAALEVFERVFHAVAGPEEDVVFALHDGTDVDGDGAAEVDAEVRGAASDVGRMGAGDHGLGGGAAGVDAGAAPELALDDGDGHAGGGEALGERGSGLAGADDNGVEVFGHGCSDGPSVGLRCAGPVWRPGRHCVLPE